MSGLRVVWRAFLGRSSWERDLEAELLSHVEYRTEDLIRAGLPREEAARKARLEFGCRDAYKERCREAHGLRWLDECRQDLRYTLRTLRRSPAFTAAAIVSLALGIGVTAAVFGLLDAVFWKPLPVRNPHELAAIYTVSRAGQTPALTSCSYADFLDLRDGASVFKQSAVFGRVPVRLGFEGDTERIPAELVTGNYFAVVGIAPRAGRLLEAKDDLPGAVPAAVISDSLWERRFGRDPEILGKPIRMERAAFIVVGVAPNGFRGTVLDWGGTPDIWVPLSQYRLAVPQFRRSDMLNRRDIRWLLIISRLDSDVTVSQAQAAADVIANRLAREYVATNARQSFRVFPANEGRFWPGRRKQSVQFALLLSWIAGAILLISCFNVSSMLVARTLAQAKEISLRLAIGAGALRIARERLSDSLALAVLGCAASIPVAMALTGALRAFPLPFLVSISADVQIDWRVGAFAAAVSVLIAGLAGTAPALHAWHTDISGTLKGAGNLRRRRLLPGSLRQVLIVAQVALSFVLLTGAGLLSRSLQGLERTDPGYVPDGVVVASIELAAEDATPESIDRIYRGVLSRVSAIPGVEGAGLSSEILPTMSRWTKSVRPRDTPAPPGAAAVPVDASVISPGYFEALRVPLIAGRDFRPQDDASAPPAVIVTQAAARRFWGSTEVTGKRLRIDGEDRDREVIGVARDIKYHELFEAPAPYLFLPASQTSWMNMNLHVRINGNAPALATALRRELPAGTGVRILQIEPLEDYIARRLSQPRLAATLGAIVAAIGLILSAVGLHGMMAYFVVQQRHEIGIRIAVGAAARDVVKLVAGRGLILALAGLAVGTPLALWSAPLLRSQLHGVSSSDPVIYVSAAAAFVAVTGTASIGPALRALGIHPTSLLRTQ
ncbi:MAG: ABC transporter permease [Bryobacterales bacterium]|nr:ABC transporter permease [Bryobacterales bacterium]